MRDLLPPKVAELLTGAPQCNFRRGTFCYETTTDQARLVAAALDAAGIAVQTEADGNDSGVPLARLDNGKFNLSFLPYLPHNAPVSCCAG